MVGAVPALLIEGCGGWSALSRSFRLVRGRWWPAAGVRFVAAVMTSIVSGAIEGLLVAISLSSSADVAPTATVVSLAAGLSAVLTRRSSRGDDGLDDDLRVRHEGYDVALLAEQLGSSRRHCRLELRGGRARDGGQPEGPPFWPPPPGWRPSPSPTAVDGEQH